MYGKSDTATGAGDFDEEGPQSLLAVELLLREEWRFGSL